MDFGTATNIALTAYVAGTSIVGSITFVEMLVKAFKKKPADKEPLITVSENKDSEHITLPEITALRLKINTLRSKFQEAEIAKFSNATTPQELAEKAIAMKHIDNNVDRMVEKELRGDFIKSLPDNIIAHIIKTGDNVFNLDTLHVFSFHPNAEILGYNKTVEALTEKCVFRLYDHERNHLGMQLYREGFTMKYNMDDFSITVTPNIK